MRNHLLVLFCCLWVSLSWGQERLVAEVKLQGNKRTKAAFLYKIIQLKAGEALDTAVVAEDIYRLK